MVLWSTLNIYTETHPPVVESQRFLFISRGHFVLKEEDLNQSDLEDHQADHQTDGQTERHGEKVSQPVCLSVNLTIHSCIHKHRRESSLTV